MKYAKRSKNSDSIACQRLLCSHKGMTLPDIGRFIRGMRKSRGLTLVDLAAQAGVSLSSVKKLEASADEVNLLPTTLDAILTAMAMHAPLGPSEIGQLSKSVGRQYESLERLNDQAQRRLRAANASPTPTKRDEPTLEERLQHAVHLLVAAGMGKIGRAHV